MALGDYEKTTYVEGSPPGISATRLNRNENKTKEIDDWAKTHSAEKATDEVLGHIKIGSGLSIDLNGIVSATGFKVGAFTRDSSLDSGTQAITGVGFKPRAILLMGAGNSPEASIMVSDGVSNEAIYNGHNITANMWSVHGGIRFSQNSGTVYIGTIVSFDADGFTISWEKTGVKTGMLYLKYIAIK